MLLRPTVCVVTAITLSGASALATSPATFAATPVPASVAVAAPASASAVLAAPVQMAVPGGAAAFAAGASPAVARALAAGSRSRYLRSSLSGRVVDRSTGALVWSYNASRTRMPASTQKVMTALTALRSMPASKRIVTQSLQSEANPGNVYLRGGGDPSLTTTRLTQLAAATSAQLKSQGRNRVALYLDDSVFPAPSLATGWKRAYVGHDAQWVRGLTLARYRGADATVAAGNVFRAQLKRHGVTVSTIGRGVTPAQRTLLAATSSATVGSLVAHTLNVSDNDYAEYLLRLSALEAGRYPTWANAVAHERSVLADAGVPLTGYRVYDGSGLSRSDRMPVATLTAAVAALYARPADRGVVFAPGALPRSGQSGTLRARYRTGVARCAAGRVIAKTGTLNDVVALAGLAKGSDGRDRIFAFVENGQRNTQAARAAVDAMAAKTVGCAR